MKTGRRFVVVGTSGSGKTTMARRIARRLGIPHIELDALYWGPHWSPSTPESFRARAAQALEGDAWAVDGNYSIVRDIIWSRADTLVWLNYSLPVIMGRVVWRTLRRVVTREELWSGNRESLRTALFSRDSIILWALQTYWRRRRNYPRLLAQPQHAHLTVVHLHSPREAEAWLAGLRS